MKIISAMFEVRTEDDDEDVSATLMEALEAIGFNGPVQVTQIPSVDDPETMVCVSIDPEEAA